MKEYIEELKHDQSLNFNKQKLALVDFLASKDSDIAKLREDMEKLNNKIENAQFEVDQLRLFQFQQKQSIEEGAIEEEGSDEEDEMNRDLSEVKTAAKKKSKASKKKGSENIKS